MREQSWALDILNRLNYIQRVIYTATLTLGGTSGEGGGTGAPPGGFSGVLPQTRVAGDTTESHIASSGSNANLLYNLNNIRAWLEPTRSFFARETNPATNFLDVSSGSWHYSSGVEPLIYGDGTTPAVSLPSSGSRIDLLTVSTAGALAWVQGTESWSPDPPTMVSPTSGVMPLWEVIFSTSGSAIHNYNRGENYIWRDVRPFLDWGIGGAGGSSGSGAFGTDFPQDVGASAVIGTSGSFPHSDHIHRGVSSWSVQGQSPLYGPLIVSALGNITLDQSSGSLSITGLSTSGSSVYQWVVDGPLSSGSEVGGVYATPESFVSQEVVFHFKTAGSSGSTQIDVLYSVDNTSWTSLFSSPPSIPFGNTTWTESTLATTVPQFAYVRMDILSTGSGFVTLSANWIAQGSSGGGSGGGATIYESAYASPPATPTNGDDWIVSDAGLLAHRASSTWSFYGPIFPLTVPPASGNWTALNLSTNAIGDWTRGVIDFTCTVSAGDNLRGYYRAMPSPVKAIMGCTVILQKSAYTQMGLFVRESGSGKCKSFLFRSGLDTPLQYTTWNSASSFGAESSSISTGQIGLGGLLWVKYEEDTTNRIISLSRDGYLWFPVLTEAKTTFLTADQIGFAGYAADTSAGVTNIMTVYSWEEG